MAWTSEMKVSFNAATDLSLSQQDLWCAFYSMENMQNWYGILPDTRFRGKRHWQRDSYDDILEIRSEAFLSRLIIYSMRVMIWWSETILKFYELYREVYSILLILVFLFAFRWIKGGKNSSLKGLTRILHFESHYTLHFSQKITIIEE